MKKILVPISTLLLFAVGCDNPIRSNAIDLDSEELQAFSSELSSDLGLNQLSASVLNSVLNKHGRNGKHREPGFLWKIAGELADSLSEEEKVVLFEKMDDKDISLFGGNKKRGSKSKGGKKGKNGFGSIAKVLTDEQLVIFKEILSSYKEKFKVIHNQVKDGTLLKDDAKAQIEPLKEAMQVEIDALLTDEQKAQIEQNKFDKKAKKQAYKDSSKAIMVDVLDMAPEQLATFESLHEQTRATAKVLFEQSKAGDLDRESFRVALKNLFASKNEKLEALFTVGQLEIIKIHKALELRMKKHRGNKGKKGGSKKRGVRKSN